MNIVVSLILMLQLEVRVSVPTIRFEAPPRVTEVQPGLYVVPEYDEEVFFADGFYWVRWRDGRWYRARDYRGGWVAAPPAGVPVFLVNAPPGRYKHHKAKPEKLRVVNPDGSVTEWKVKEKNGFQGKGKLKGKHRGRWK